MALATIADMQGDALAWLEREGVKEADRELRIAIDSRYDGQNYEVPVAIDTGADLTLEDFLEGFRARHRQEYGYDIEGREIEIVNCRVQAVGRLPKHPQVYAPRENGPARTGTRPLYFGEAAGWLETPLYRRWALESGAMIKGPAVIEEMSSTTIVHPGQSFVIDGAGNLIITIDQA